MQSCAYTDRLIGLRWASLRVRDYWLLAKPRILIVALGSVGVGFIAGLSDDVWFARFCLAMVSIGCVAYACGLLNQCVETHADLGMNRTSDRPLAAGRLSRMQVAVAGGLAAIIGITGCFAGLNYETGIAAIAVLLIYVGVYTPLKTVSFLGTVAGAVAGAMPPLLGWFASGAGMAAAGWWLFLFVFAWQFPHFLAIATVYRRDYESVGYRMLPTDSGGRSYAGVVSVAYACSLCPIGYLLEAVGLIGKGSAAVTLAVAVLYLLCSVAFWWSDSVNQARRLLVVSLVFLTYVFGAIACHRLAMWG